MTSNEAGAVIRILDRDLRVARLTRSALVLILLGGITAAVLSPEHAGQVTWLWIGTMTAAMAWAVLTVISTRQVKAANQASIFVANGRLDLAETQLRESLRSFTIYGAAKVLACHNLAVVAHGRGEYGVAAELCDGLLKRVRNVNPRARRTTRMLLADCRLFLKDVTAARTALNGLNVADSELSLAERLMLLPIQVRCDVMSGQNESAASDLKEKVRLAEQLESPRAALVHLMLGDACESLKRSSEAGFLKARAALYHDLSELHEHYPLPVLNAVSGTPDVTPES